MDRYNKSRAELRSKEEYHNRSRSRSVSPQQSYSSESARSRDNESTSRKHREEHRQRRRSSSPPSEERIKGGSTKAPPAPVISKVSMSLKSTQKPGIQLKLNAAAKKPTAPQPKPSVASAFNDESDDEVEEMPAECKMRMRNIGKNTPTSSGPNSFGKTKLGFVDSKKIFEKKMQEYLKNMP